MPTFDIDPSSDIAGTGWTETGDSKWEDLTSTSDSDEVTTDDDNSNALILGGVTLPTNFPEAGADSVTYHIRMRTQNDKPDPLPRIQLKVTDSDNEAIATATGSLGSSPTAFTDYTGSLVIDDDRNTEDDWTGHRLWLLPQSLDDIHTDFEVSELQATVTYTEANDPPEFTSDPFSKADAYEDTLYTGQTLAGSATDPDGDTLTYSKVSGPTWLYVASNGALSGTPSQTYVGENSWTVQVSDGEGGTDTATLNITVVNVNDAPEFTSDPITKNNAYEDDAYTNQNQTLAGSATDEDGDTLTYSKVSGPAWLSIAASGALTGTPAFADRGVNSWSVQVSDGQAVDTATLNITVLEVGGEDPPDGEAVPAAIMLLSSGSVIQPPVAGFSQ